MNKADRLPGRHKQVCSARSTMERDRQLLASQQATIDVYGLPDAPDWRTNYGEDEGDR